MSWEAISAVGEIVGSIAVVVSLLYLTTQVKQANRQSASDAGFAFLSELNRLNDFVFTDPEGASIVVKLKSDAELTAEEQVKVEAFTDRAINTWYSAEVSYRKGIFDQDLFDDVLDDVKRYLRMYPGLRKYLLAELNQYTAAKDLQVFIPVFDKGTV